MMATCRKCLKIFLEKRERKGDSNMKKKLTALALAAVMAASLAACGASSDSAAASAPAASAAAEETAASAESTAAAEEAPAADAATQDFAGETLVIGVWGGTWKESFDAACVKPFEEAYGVTIEEEEMGDNIVAQVIAQTEQDIEGIDLAAGVGAADFCAYLGTKNAVKELDYSRLPNAEPLDDLAKTKYGVGMYICAEAWVYDNDAFPETPVGSEGFFDTTNTGDRCMRSWAGSGLLEQALLADGVAYEDLYPVDLDRAFAKLDTIKPYITKYWSSGAEIYQTISDKEAVAGEYWFSHANRAINDGANASISYQDAVKFADSFAMTANTKKEDLAYAFIDFCLSPEVQANFSKLVGYAPINKDALPYLDAAQQEELACMYLPYEEGGTFWADIDYWGENYEAVSERYELWKAG